MTHRRGARRFTGDDVLNVRILGLVLESKRRFI